MRSVITALGLSAALTLGLAAPAALTTTTATAGSDGFVWDAAPTGGTV